MEELKHDVFSKSDESEVEVLRHKINEIVEWINKHDSISDDMIKKLDVVFDMRKKEHDMTMKLGETSSSMMKAIKKLDEE